MFYLGFCHINVHRCNQITSTIAYYVPCANTRPPQTRNLKPGLKYYQEWKIIKETDFVKHWIMNFYFWNDSLPLLCDRYPFRAVFTLSNNAKLWITMSICLLYLFFLVVSADFRIVIKVFDDNKIYIFQMCKVIFGASSLQIAPFFCCLIILTTYRFLSNKQVSLVILSSIKVI